MNRRLKALLVLAGIIGVAAFSANLPGKADPETFRLVHAIENDETIIARGLSKPECERRKKDHKVVAEALGIYNERLGIGSITCLPESLFND